MPGRFVRRRPLLRTAVIGGGAYMAGRSAATRRDAAAGQDAQMSAQEQQGGAAEPSQQAAGTPMLDQLDRLTALHQQGTLTDAEFSAAKAKLLGS